MRSRAALVAGAVAAVLLGGCETGAGGSGSCSGSAAGEVDPATATCEDTVVTVDDPGTTAPEAGAAWSPPG